MKKRFYKNPQGMDICEDHWEALGIIPLPEEIYEDEAIQDPMGNWVIWHAYNDYRRQSMPPIGDQLDAIYKQMELLASSNIEIHPDTQSWMDKIKLIKERFPKKK
jgi:hypothetical protein